MNFYTGQHQYYCGIDLHSKTMFICILDASGNKVLHRNIRNDVGYFLKLIAPYRENLVVSAECIYSWYWLADLCADEGIAFVLGHALYMKAIHGGKAKNDRIDSEKIASLLRGGLIPQAYVYPKRLRASRDLMRRRSYFVRKRAELLTHMHLVNHQYNLEPFAKRISYKANRQELPEHFSDTMVQTNIAADVTLAEHLDELVKELERTLSRQASLHETHNYHLLKTIPGVGPILAMTILFEIESITRFARVQEFLSYSRLVKCAKESAGKTYGTSGKKMGNVHLKWAFSEAAVLFMAKNENAKKLVQRLEKKHGKGKALSILAAKLGRASYHMLKRQHSFDEIKFFG